MGVADSSESEAEDFVAFFEVGNGGTEGGDDAGELDAEDLGSLRRGRVSSLALGEVYITVSVQIFGVSSLEEMLTHTVEAESPHFDQNFSVFGDGSRDIIIDEESIGGAGSVLDIYPYSQAKPPS